jgi:acyl dehydratase
MRENPRGYHGYHKLDYDYDNDNDNDNDNDCVSLVLDSSLKKMPMTNSSLPKTDCLTAAMLTVGQSRTERLRFTRDQVDTYCALTGDANAIHRDLEAARRRFPGVTDIVVPGGLIQSTISGIFGTRFPGDGALGLTFVPERFRKPVLPDEEVVVNFEITRIKGPIIELEMTVTDTRGTRLTSATAKVLAPDPAYRDWWEQQTQR